MGLDPSNQLALVALIVSLIALIISAWQLVQQLFATAADGKRFCQRSVMGIWARKTRLSWRWSQIRFEAKYTTPDIRLSSGVNATLVRKTGSSQISRKLVPRRRLMYRIPVFRQITEVFNGPAQDFEGYFDVTASNADEPWELRKTRLPSHRIVPRTFIEHVSLLRLQLWHYIDQEDTTEGRIEQEDRGDNYNEQEDSADIVTWPKLLHKIHDNQVHSIATTEENANDVLGAKDSEDRFEKTEAHQDGPIDNNQTEDRVIVKLVERSWDLVPPDVVRPLARSNIGSIIVIAHRLGMQWSDEFSPTNGKMNAAGYGHEISSETIRGLGIVLQYSFRDESRKIKEPGARRELMDEGEYFAPTVAADKLHCGIIPIDENAIFFRPKQVVRDIQLVNPARETSFEGLYDTLGIPRDLRDKIDKEGSDHKSGAPGRKFKHAFEDAIALLSPLASLPISSARSVMWPLRNRFRPFTPLRQDTGVQQLRTRLEEFMDEPKKWKKASKMMNTREGTLLEPLSKSPLEYLNDICGWSSIHRPEPSAPFDPVPFESVDQYIDRQTNKVGLQGRTQMEMREAWFVWARTHPSFQPQGSEIMNRYIATIHKETSKVFRLVNETVGPPENSSRDAESSRPFLIDLVAAHVVMAAKHGEEADDNSKKNKSSDDETFMEGRLRFVHELATLYASDIEGTERAVAKHLRRRGYSLDQLEPYKITALWWVLVLRGICWWMTVQLKLPESQIPSHWYNSQTPVYIT